MVWVPDGTFVMGSDHHYPEEAPAHRVRVDGFWIDRCTVTNDEFAAFAAGHGYEVAYDGLTLEVTNPASAAFDPAEHWDYDDPNRALSVRLTAAAWRSLARSIAFCVPPTLSSAFCVSSAVMS